MVDSDITQKQTETYDSASLERIEEFKVLYDEFLSSFLHTEKGERHIRYIVQGREEAEKNISTVNKATENGEDITDLVLLKLLPYNDFKNNRDKGAWINVAPAIKGNIKSWFENAGRTFPEDWPKISRAILSFVNRCMENPENLNDACIEFSELPYSTGLQTGMLTPILNALNPESFLLINNKSREVINHFTGSDYGQALVNYPEINKTGKQLINDVRPVLDRAESVEISSVDLFDIFCHWLVSEKQYFKPAKLGKNFIDLFGTVDDAMLAFRFLGVAVRYLNIDDKDDPRAALSFYRDGKELKMHLSYGNWAVLGFQGSNERINKVLISVFKDSIKLNTLSEGDFVTSDTEPKITLNYLSLDEFKANHLALLEIFQETLEHIQSKFAHWKASPYHKYNKDKILEALIDESLLESLLAEGVTPGDGQPEETTRYWKIAPGREAWNWDTWKSENIITIGWDQVGDLSGKTKEEIDLIYDQACENYSDWGTGGNIQLGRFMEVQIGDRIIANQGKGKILGFGTVIGDYYFVPDVTHGHRIPVQWDDLEIREIDEGGWAMTILNLDEDKFNHMISIKPIDIETRLEEVLSQQPFYSLEMCSEETGFGLIELSRYIRAVDRKKQAIFYGPPGTGKTYLAERIAKHLVGGGYGFIDLIQFHSEVAYEDFIQGIRPQENEKGELRYPLVPGRFMDFCNKASQTKDICVLIIDEINRANLSRVFGELMYLLEYRDKTIYLAAGQRFKIPANVRIIGTMNTADRSIALVDHALRRRFAFLSLYPDYELLRKYHQKTESGFNPETLINILNRLNKQIGDRHYFIGPSYFLRDDIRVHLKDIWQMEIEPYLEEFFFDQPDNYKKFVWETIEDEIGQ